MPCVSVVIPFYSGVEWLRDAINSVFNQTFKDYEIIVVNDGSKESLGEIINQYGELIQIINKTNGGPASARNIGIDKAKGKYIAFLDSDDLWDKHKLEYQVLEMEKNKGIWSQTSLEYFGENIRSKVIDTSCYQGKVFPMCLTSFRIQTSSIMVLNEVMKEYRLRFNEKKRYGEDCDLWIELATRYELIAIKEPLTKFRIRNNNAGFDAEIQLNSRAETYKDIKDSRLKIEVAAIPKDIKYIYRLCCIMSGKAERISHKISYRKDIVYKGIYLPLWVLFKLLFIKYKYKK